MSPPRSPGQRLLERLYRLVLHLYPSPFRERYGEEMCAVVRGRYAGEEGRGGGLRQVVWYLLEDLFRTLPEERRAQRRQRMRGRTGGHQRGNRGERGRGRDDPSPDRWLWRWVH